MKEMFKRFMKEESGATMVEYAILVALIAVAAIVIIGVLGGQINAAFKAVSDQLSTQGVSS
jgi:pilus assembly protein Flp/PilA